MAELIHASENGHDHDAAPLQVPLRHVDLALNTGIFSRNREIIQGSTFSVLGGRLRGFKGDTRVEGGRQ